MSQKKGAKKLQKKVENKTCEYMEREARFCKGYCMRVDVLGLYLDLSQRMYS